MPPKKKTDIAFAYVVYSDDQSKETVKIRRVNSFTTKIKENFRNKYSLNPAAFMWTGEIRKIKCGAKWKL